MVQVTSQAEARYCPRCDKMVAEVDFTKNAARTTGYGSYCRACQSQIMAERREANRA